MIESTDAPSTPIQVFSTAPISIPVLKRKFTEDIEFVIDYDNSKYKGKTLIQYLSNLNISVKIIVKDFDGMLDLMKHYFNSPTLVHIGDLEDMAMQMLLAYTGKHHGLDFDTAPFFEENKEILDKWVRRLNSGVLYAIKADNRFSAGLEQYPKDPDSSLGGINFVTLFEHPFFTFFIEGVDITTLSWNPSLFEENMFAGSNMFEYFASKENPLFIGLLGIQDEESFNLLTNAIKEEHQTLSGLLAQDNSNVPSV